MEGQRTLNRIPLIRRALTLHRVLNVRAVGPVDLVVVELHGLVGRLLWIGEERALDILTGCDLEDGLCADGLVDMKRDRIDGEPAALVLLLLVRPLQLGLVFGQSIAEQLRFIVGQRLVGLGLGDQFKDAIGFGGGVEVVLGIKARRVALPSVICYPTRLRGLMPTPSATPPATTTTRPSRSHARGRCFGVQAFGALRSDYLLELDIQPLIPSKSNRIVKQGRSHAASKRAYRDHNIIERLSTG